MGLAYDVAMTNAKFVTPMHPLLFPLVAIGLLVQASACGSVGSSLALQDPAPRYLPGGTELWIGSANPEALLTAMGRDAIVDLIGPDYMSFQKEAENEVGVDPFDPASMVRAGLDPTKPFGFMMVDIREEIGGGYAHVSDIARFVSALDRFARSLRARRASESIGDGTVYTFGSNRRKGRLCVAVHGTFAMVLATDRRKNLDRVRRACYSVAAGGDGKTALARSANFQRAMGLLERGSDLYGFADLRAMITGGKTFRHHAEPRGPEDDQRLRRERMAKDSDTARGFYQTVAGLSFGVDMTPERALLDVRLAMLPNAAPLPFTNTSAAKTNTSLARRARLIDVAFTFDPQAGASWLLLALGANPLAAYGWNSAAEWSYPLIVRGVEPDKDLSAWLDGTAGMTADCEEGVRFMRRCTGMLHFGVTDAAKVKALLQPPKEAGFGVRWVDVVNDRLVIGMDGERSASMAEGTAKPLPAPAALVDTVDVERTGRIRLNASLLLAPLLEAAVWDGWFGGSRSWRTGASSPEAKALVEQIRRLESEYAKARRAHMAPNREAWGRFAANLGTLDLALVAGADHLAGLGGMVPRPGTWSDISKQAAQLKARRRALLKAWLPKQEAHKKQVDTLWEQVDALGK